MLKKDPLIHSLLTNKLFIYIIQYEGATVAQLVEQLIRNQQVGGSSPPSSSIIYKIFSAFFILIIVFIS